MSAFSGIIPGGKHSGASLFNLFAAQRRLEQPPEYSQTTRDTIAKCRMLMLHIDQLDTAYGLAIDKIPDLEKRTRRIAGEGNSQEKSQLREDVEALREQMAPILNDSSLLQNVFQKAKHIGPQLEETRMKLEEERTRRLASSSYLRYIQQDIKDVRRAQSHFDSGERSHTIIYENFQNYLTRLDALSKELEPRQSLEERSSEHSTSASSVDQDIPSWI